MGAAGVGVLRVEGVLAEGLHGLHVAHVLQILEVPHSHLLDLVAGTEAVEEVDEGHLAGDGGQMGHRGEVHDLLNVALSQHGKAGLTAGHHVGVKINEKLGTNYQLFNYYGAPDADRVIIAMGSICDVAEEVIDYMNAHGEKVGLVKVRLYRPFAADKLLSAIPATAKKSSSKSHWQLIMNTPPGLTSLTILKPLVT